MWHLCAHAAMVVVWLLQHRVVDAVVTQEGEVVLLGVPKWAAESPLTSGTTAAAAAAVSSSTREPTTFTDYKLVRMKADAGSVLTSSATGAATTTSTAAATATAAADSQDYEFAPLHVLEEIRYALIGAQQLLTSQSQVLFSMHDDARPTGDTCLYGGTAAVHSIAAYY
jgi:hypothetical protein